MAKKEEKTLEEQVFDEIKRLGLSPTEAKKVLGQLQGTNPRKYHGKKINGNSKTSRFGVLSDQHMGHHNYRGDVLRDAANYWSKSGIDFILFPGDTIEGMSNRDGHIYELDYIGVSAQMDFFGKEMEQLKDWNVYAIEAQDSHGGWAHNKANQGLNIGEELERRADNYHFLGYDEQDLMVDNIALRLRHPGGGTAYALCFDDKTEILSENGWKLFKELSPQEKVATLNLKNDEFEWQTPTEYTDEHYNGEMLHFNSRTVDLLVTPNHRMLVRKYPNNLLQSRSKILTYPTKSHRRISFDWVFKEAKELVNAKRQEWQMKRTSSKWNGELTEFIDIPERKVKKFGKRQSPRIERIHIDDVAELIAWYVTEGYIRDSLIEIAQHKKINPHNYSEILDMWRRIGLTPKEDKNKQHIKTYSLELAEWLVSECGSGSKNKHLPKWLKNQPQDVLRVIFDTMVKGDGWSGSQIGYRSISRQLLDDFTEISLKLGYAVSTNKDSVSVSEKQVLPTINKKPEVIEYTGRVYCVSVPNTTLMVRRNGKAIWSGNSYKMQKYLESLAGGEKPNAVFQGHFHKANYMFYRNIHAIDAGALQDQSQFMKKKGSPSNVGFWTVEMEYDKKGITRFKPEFTAYYD